MEDAAPSEPRNRVSIAIPWAELVEGARRGEHASAQYLLQRVVHELRYGAPLEAVVSEYLAEAIAQVVRAPGQAAQAFGLSPKRGAPPRDSGLRRYAGHRVLSLVDAGVPLNDGRATDTWDGTGAIARAVEALAAEGVEVTESQAARGYNAAQMWRARHRIMREQARARLAMHLDEVEAGGGATR